MYVAPQNSLLDVARCYKVFLKPSYAFEVRTPGQGTSKPQATGFRLMHVRPLGDEKRALGDKGS